MMNSEQERLGDTVPFGALHCSGSITKLAKAMLKVQKAIGPAFKDAANDFTKSRYATLNSVMDSCIEILTANGIWVSQFPVDTGREKELGLVTKLVHVESGEWQSSLLVMPLPKADPQGYGSALTYARRYGLSAMVGIVSEDDDANLACNNGSKMIVQQPFIQGKQQQPAPMSVENNQPIQRSEPKGVNTQVGANLPNGAQPQNSSCRDLPVSAQVSSGNSLPRIDGVQFQQLTAGNGQPYVVATGSTRGKSPMLKSAGFQWDSSGKRWWRYAC